MMADAWEDRQLNPVVFVRADNSITNILPFSPSFLLYSQLLFADNH